MTELSQIILQDHLVRKTKTQKDKFITLLQQHFPQLKVEKLRIPPKQKLDRW